MDKLEQIEGCRIALKSHWEGKNEDIQRGVIDDLCTLAKRGLATRKRPIAEAPKIDGVDLLVFGIQDGRPYTDIVRVSGNGFLAFDPLADRYCHESSGHTHFIPLSTLEEE